MSGARAVSRTTSRSGRPRPASAAATRPPTCPDAPVMAIMWARLERLGDEHGGAERERGDGDRPDQARRRPAVDPGLVDDRVALAATDQPAVHRHGDDPGDGEGERQAAPEQDV